MFGAAFVVFETVYGVRPPDLFQMFEEASTGYSGAVGRQLTLNTATATLPATLALLAELESRRHARRGESARPRPPRAARRPSISATTRPTSATSWHRRVIAHAPPLLAEAQPGTTLATLTAQLRANVDDGRQPLLATAGAIGNGLIGDPPLPRLAIGPRGVQRDRHRRLEHGESSSWTVSPPRRCSPARRGAHGRLLQQRHRVDRPRRAADAGRTASAAGAEPVGLAVERAADLRGAEREPVALHQRLRPSFL